MIFNSGMSSSIPSVMEPSHARARVFFFACYDDGRLRRADRKCELAVRKRMKAH